MRKYKTYQDYKDHQGSKLEKKYTSIVAHDRLYEEIVFNRYTDFNDKLVLCLAARLGGEVRAFKRRGADAIGIDLNPGKDNKDVIYGDFHDIPFKSDWFDYVFTNSIDHVLYPKKMFSEAHRVLKPGGIFILEIHPGKMGEYEVLDANEKRIIRMAKKYFVVLKRQKSMTFTQLLSGDTLIYYLCKK